MSLAAGLRLLLLLALVALLEVLCRVHVIDKITMQPPHQMAADLWHLLASGGLTAAILKTLGNAAIACAGALLLGVAAAVALRRFRTARRILDPVFATWYAVPVFAFYPLLIIIFGAGDTPEIFIGFMLAVFSVIVTMSNGLDRVPRVLLKTAAVMRLGRTRTVLRVLLPSTAPHLVAAARLALTYSLIGVIGAEFIMATSGMGYEINFAYNDFDNRTMYPLILLIVFVSVAVNSLLAWIERILLTRAGLA